MSRLCAKALNEGIEVEYVQRLIRKRSLLPDSFGRTLENWPWPLKIFTLGRFSLEKNGKPLRFPGKAPEKALLMLKALIAVGEKDVGEEQITDIIWPESEGDVAHSAFTTLLSRLRKLLDTEDCIKFEGGNVGVNPQICWVDAWAFDEIVSQTEKAWEDRKFPERFDKAVRLTEKALAIYKGNFLKGDEEYDWTTPERERFRRKFLFLVGKLGDYLEQSKKWTEAVELYQNGLRIDKLSEEFYQNLMICYAELGQKTEAARVYMDCRRAISETLGMEISRKTESIYQSLHKK